MPSNVFLSTLHRHWVSCSAFELHSSCYCLRHTCLNWNRLVFTRLAWVKGQGLAKASGAMIIIEAATSQKYLGVISQQQQEHCECGNSCCRCCWLGWAGQGRVSSRSGVREKCSESVDWPAPEKEVITIKAETDVAQTFPLLSAWQRFATLSPLSLSPCLYLSLSLTVTHAIHTRKQSKKKRCILFSCLLWLCLPACQIDALCMAKCKRKLKLKSQSESGSVWECLPACLLSSI